MTDKPWDYYVCDLCEGGLGDRFGWRECPACGDTGKRVGISFVATDIDSSLMRWSLNRPRNERKEFIRKVVREIISMNEIDLDCDDNFTRQPKAI